MAGQIANERPALADSLWTATANPSPDRPPLKGKAEADTVVIGGGFTGLNAALHAAEGLVGAGGAMSEALIDNRGIAMSIDLTGDTTGLVGYRGMRHTGVVDGDKRDACDVRD